MPEELFMWQMLCLQQLLSANHSALHKICIITREQMPFKGVPLERRHGKRYIRHADHAHLASVELELVLHCSSPRAGGTAAKHRLAEGCGWQACCVSRTCGGTDSVLLLPTLIPHALGISSTVSICNGSGEFLKASLFV